MKYSQMDFDDKLRNEIKYKEVALKDLIEKLLRHNKSALNKKNFEVGAGFDKVGENPFEPGYSSSISMGITDKSGELIDLHIIKIWECERFFLGIPMSKNILGSKVYGELLDETLEEVKQELEGYLKEVLQMKKNVK